MGGLTSEGKETLKKSARGDTPVPGWRVASISMGGLSDKAGPLHTSQSKC